MHVLFQNKKIVPATLCAMLGIGLIFIAISPLMAPNSDIYWLAGGITLASFSFMLMMTYLPWPALAVIFFIGGMGTIAGGIFSSTWALGFAAISFVTAAVAMFKACYNAW